jgi:hypothetical protein
MGESMAVSKTALRSKKKLNNNLKPAPEPSSQEPPASEVEGKPGRKPGCKPRGRKAAACRKLKPGIAGSNLRKAINVAVASQPDTIAKALIEGTIKGSVGSAKLLIDLTGADKPDEKKKRRGPSLADILARDEPWQDPPDAEPWGDPFARMNARAGSPEPEL